MPQRTTAEWQQADDDESSSSDDDESSSDGDSGSEEIDELSGESSESDSSTSEEDFSSTDEEFEDEVSSITPPTAVVRDGNIVEAPFFDEEESSSDESEDDSESSEEEPDYEGGMLHDEENPKRLVEDDEENKDGRFSKTAMVLCAVCCVCLLVILAIVLLAVFLTRDDKEPSPTQAPSPSPTIVPVTPSPTVKIPSPKPTPFPTDSPTMSRSPTGAPTKAPTGTPTIAPSMPPSISASPTEPVPDELLLIPDEDTFIFADGLTPGTAYGTEDFLLVQNGPLAINEVADAFALMTFNLERLPAPFRITDREPQALLRLNHIVEDNADELAPSTLRVVRLPETRLRVETLHGFLFSPFGGVEGPEFTVDPFDRQIEVDITSLIFGRPPFTENRRNGRRLQGQSSQLFLMIENQGAEQPLGGNRFSSRETESPPELFIGLFLPGQPRPTPAPLAMPTVSPRPSTTYHPSMLPSTSQLPSEIPSSEPSTSVQSPAPSISVQPSAIQIRA